MNIDGHILMMEGDEESIQKFIAMIRKGDPRCRFQPGDRVYKARNLEMQELTPIGTMGKVFGCIYLDDPAASDKECYWVTWDGNPMVITTVGSRLEKAIDPKNN